MWREGSNEKANMGEDKRSDVNDQTQEHGTGKHLYMGLMRGWHDAGDGYINGYHNGVGDHEKDTSGKESGDPKNQQWPRLVIPGDGPDRSNRMSWKYFLSVRGRHYLWSNNKNFCLLSQDKKWLSLTHVFWVVRSLNNIINVNIKTKFFFLEVTGSHTENDQKNRQPLHMLQPSSPQLSHISFAHSCSLSEMHWQEQQAVQQHKCAQMCNCK